MDFPEMCGAQRISQDTFQLSAFLPVAELGVLPLNAFVIDAAEPVLVDTGLGALRNGFVEALTSVIALERLRWIWLSHLDADHIGNLQAVLELAPNASIVTNFLGMGKLMLAGMAVDRVHLLEPGRGLSVGDRELVPLRPLYYDAPETVGFFDTRTRALFAADAFGALVSAPVFDSREISEASLRDGLITWAGIDAPWLGSLDQTCLARSIAAFERLDPSVVLSSHLPPAIGMTDRLLHHVAEAARTAEGKDAYAIGGLALPDVLTRLEGDERERVAA